MDTMTDTRAAMDRWGQRMSAARNTGRTAEQQACTMIGGIYMALSTAEARAEDAAKRLATDANSFAVEDVMKARASQVTASRAIALIEHLDDTSSPVEIVDQLREHVVSMVVYSLSNGSQSTSMIATAEKAFEAAAMGDLARIVRVG